MLQLLIILLAYRERMLRILHFAKVDDAILAIDQQIDLCARAIFLASPRKRLGRNAGDAELALHLRDMEQAQLLERIAAPSETPAIVMVIRPKVLVFRVVAIHVFQPIQRKRIDKPVIRIILAFSEIRILLDKPALLQFAERFGQIAASGDIGDLYDIVSCQAGFCF